MFIPCPVVAGQGSDRITMKKSATQYVSWIQKEYDRSNVNYVAAYTVMAGVSFAVAVCLTISLTNDDLWVSLAAAKCVLGFTIFDVLWLFWLLRTRKLRARAFEFLAAEQLLHNRMIHVVPNTRPDPVSQVKIDELEALIDEE